MLPYKLNSHIARGKTNPKQREHQKGIEEFWFWSGKEAAETSSLRPPNRQKAEQTGKSTSLLKSYQRSEATGHTAAPQMRASQPDTERRHFHGRKPPAEPVLGEENLSCD